MKRKFMVLIVTSIAFFCNTVSFAARYGDFTYIESKDGTITITDYNEPEEKTQVIIPSAIGGNPVVEIGYSAFKNRKMKEVIIPEGVMKISDRAFYDCSSLERISMPDSVKKLGKYSFAYCENLSDVRMSKNINEIPEECFYYIKKIKTIDLSSVEFIRESAFAETSLISVNLSQTREVGDFAFKNSKLEKVFISSKTNKIGKAPFSGCISLKEIEVSWFNFKYYSKNNVLFDDDNDILIQYPSGKTDDHYTVPDRIKKIGPYSFYSSKVKKITLPSTIENISDQAFAYCRSLSQINLPHSLKRIETNAFYDTGSLTGITFPGSLESIGSYSFKNSGLKKIYIPSSVSSIGDSAFTNCRSLEEIVVSPDNRMYKTEDHVLLSKDGSVLYVYPAGNHRNRYISPGSVKKIYDDAFYNADFLETVSLPSSLTEIGSNSFYDCDLLHSPVFPSSLQKIGSNAYEYSGSITEINIGPSVKEIGSSAFNSCKNLGVVRISGSVEHIGYNAFAGSSSIGKFEIDRSNSHFTVTDDVLFNTDNKEIVQYPPAKETGTYLLPSGTEQIRSHAFAYARNLKHISLPGSLKNIESSAFYSSGLVEITIPRSVTGINYSTFSSCDNLAKAVVYDTINSIDSGAFPHNTDLVIYGYENSKIQLYCEKNDIKFIPLSISPRAGVFVGTIKKNGNELMITGSELASKVRLGDKLCLQNGNKLIVIESSFPMMTSSKFKVVKGSHKEIRPGARVYKYTE